jgi:hypothetical protein
MGFHCKPECVQIGSARCSYNKIFMMILAKLPSIVAYFVQSIRFFQASFGFLSRNKDLFILPLFDLIVNTVIACIIGWLYFSSAMNVRPHPLIFLIVIVCVWLIVHAFLAIYFNASAMVCIYGRLQGRPVSIREGLVKAAAHTGTFLVWAPVMVCVGLVVRSLQQSHKFGRIISGYLVGASWNLYSYFVVPLVLFQNKGLFAALKQSARLLNREFVTLIRSNAVFVVIYVAIFVVLWAVCETYAQYHAFSLMMSPLFKVGIALMIVLFFLLRAVSALIDAVIHMALYLKIVDAAVPLGFAVDVEKLALVPAQKR